MPDDTGIIITLSSLKATDPRDKVYGGLGILPSISKLIRPSYTTPAAIVYVVTTYAMIRHQRCLHALCYLRNTSQNKDNIDEMLVLPSWALDLSQDCSNCNDLFTVFESIGEWREDYKPILDIPSFKLHVKGTFFDEIVSCLHIVPDAYKEQGYLYNVARLRSMQSIWRAYFGLELDKSSYAAYVGGGTLEDAYWRAVIFDKVRKSEDYGVDCRAKQSDITPFVKWLRNPESDPLIPWGGSPSWDTIRHASNYQEALYHAIGEQNTYLFKTRRGYVGMPAGVPDIMVGDHLYFLDRGEVPWARRPKRDKAQSVVFEVTCQCYVHGVMDGEAFQQRPTVDSKSWKRHELRRKIFGGDSLDTTLPVGDWKDVTLV